MIDAREVAKNLRLPPQVESEVQRIGAEIDAAVCAPSFDGRPFDVIIPQGEGEKQQAFAYTIVCALERRFQARGWFVFVETFLDAFGRAAGHRLWFKIDGAALRLGHPPASVAAPPPSVVTSFSVNPMLSVIFGTYNRLDCLQRAVASIRSAVRRVTHEGLGSGVQWKPLSCEIVVCDGGSSDGSREWLSSQPDVILVGERRLDGAVRAFNQAFALCRGRYVANFNDDAFFEGDALAKAVEHLERTPSCGQVALAYGSSGDYRISEVHSDVPSTYANFGVVRRDVAERVALIQGGFWNPVYHTYAADVELSAWVWRLGFRVDKLPDARVTDVLLADELRAKNQERYGADTRRMYMRWPPATWRFDGPEPHVSPEEIERYRASHPRVSALLGDVGTATAGAPAQEKTGAVSSDALTSMVELCGLPLPEEERRLRRIAPHVRALDPAEGQSPKRADRLSRERVLHVSLATDADPQAGLCRALRALGSDGYEQVDWTYFDPVRREREILDAAKRLQPTFAFLQLQEFGAMSVEGVRALREISPEAVVATWSGDVGSHCSIWGVDGKSNMDALVPFERSVDLSLWSSLSHVRVLRAAGCHHSAYFQIGFDEEIYHPAARKIDLGFDWDAAFLGSRYANGDAFSRSVPKHDGLLRDEVVAKMREAFRSRFGLFGNGWGEGVKSVPLAQAHEVYQRSRIGLSVSLLNDLECYSSDRLFRVLGCGAALLVKRFPGMDVFGLVDGVNCLIFDTANEAVEIAKNWVDSPLLPALAAAGAKLAQEHIWRTRMHELQLYLDAVRAARVE